jgi:hypothetical protein
VRFCAPRQDHRVGIRRQDRQDLGRGIGQVPDDAERPQVPLFVFCHCGRQIVGKTVKVTVLPTSSPRSPGERRSRPCRFNVSYSINTVAARTTRIAPANMLGARSRRPTLPALCRDTGILVLYASLLPSTPSGRSERRRRPLHIYVLPLRTCSLTFEKMAVIRSMRASFLAVSTDDE